MPKRLVVGGAGFSLCVGRGSPARGDGGVSEAMPNAFIVEVAQGAGIEEVANEVAGSTGVGKASVRPGLAWLCHARSGGDERGRCHGRTFRGRSQTGFEHLHPQGPPKAGKTSAKEMKKRVHRAGSLDPTACLASVTEVRCGRQWC